MLFRSTRDRILGSIRALRDTAPEDMAVIYLAGHGEIAEDGTWYFLPYEVTFPERQEQLMQLGLSSKQLQEEIAHIGARKVVVLIDACKSGGALISLRGFEERKALLQLARSSGVHVVAAAAQDQFAGGGFVPDAPGGPSGPSRPDLPTALVVPPKEALAGSQASQ